MWLYWTPFFFQESLKEIPHLSKSYQIATYVKFEQEQLSLSFFMTWTNNVDFQGGNEQSNVQSYEPKSINGTPAYRTLHDSLVWYGIANPMPTNPKWPPILYFVFCFVCFSFCFVLFVCLFVFYQLLSIYLVLIACMKLMTKEFCV